MMAGVDVYDPERQNENQRLDNNLDNDDSEETTSLPTEYTTPITTENLEARLNALRGMQNKTFHQ